MGLLTGMSMEWTLLGAGIGIVACMTGYYCRSITRQGLFFRCPVWIWLIIAEILMVIIGMIFFPALLSVPIQALMLCLILCYPVGYSMSDPGDCAPIDLIDDCNNSDASLVYHYWHEGRHYRMPQTFFGCLESLLGARWPLEMDLSAARRTRTHTTANRFWSASINAFVAKGHVVTPGEQGILKIWTSRKVLKDGTVVEIPRYLHRAKIESHEIYFAESAIEDPNTFLLKTDTYHDAIVLAAQEKGKSLRVEIEANNAAYGAAAKVLEEMMSLDIDAPQTYDDLYNWIEEMKKKGGEEDVGESDYAEDEIIS